MDNWQARLQLAYQRAVSFIRPTGSLLPKSVNRDPSNQVSGDDSGWGASGASYNGVPGRMRQRQPFKWGS